MKKLLFAVSTVTLLAFGVAAFAAMNIAVLDYNKVMMESPQLEAATTKLKSKFEARDKEIVATQKTFQSDIESLNKNGPTMKEAEQKAAQQKIIDQQKRLQDMQVKFQNDLNVARGDAMKEIVKKIEGIVKKIAIEKKYDLVLAKAATTYSKPELEITNEVVNQMKLKK